MNPVILLVEDEPVLARNIRLFLERDGLGVAVAPSGEAGLQLLEQAAPQVVLLDYNLPGMNGLQVLERIMARAPKVRVIMMTGQGSEDVAVAALKGGAADYLKKPVHLSALRLSVDRVLARRRHDDLPAGLRASEPRRVLDTLERRRAGDAAALPVAPAADCPSPAGACEAAAHCARPCEAAPAAGPAPRLSSLVGESAAMQRLRMLVGKVIDADLKYTGGESPAVLITGETGTGKELVARALHEHGSRKAGPFVEVNCAGIPAALLEAELFGHEKGAFTDAKAARTGLIESAAGGTLFLDEIGDLDAASQTKLLKVIEDRRVRRIGATQAREIDVRFVAATSLDLEQRVRDGAFRADLYYRLRMIRIHVAPLRERTGDVLRLAEHFVGLFGARYGKPGIRLGAEAIAALAAGRWPGNVRELKNTVEQAVVLAEGGVIAAGDLCMRAAGPALEEGDKDNVLTFVERDMLAAALRETGSNVSRAARLLGISRDTLRYRVKKHQLSV